MTLTTGVAPVAAATEAAVSAVRESLARPRSGPVGLVLLVVSLDVLAAAVVSVADVWLASARATPLLALLAVAWPGAVLLTGGYARLGEGTVVRPRALLAAGSVLALLAWCAVVLVPGAGSPTDARALAAAPLVVACVTPVASIALRGLVPVLVPRRPVRVVLVGHAAEAHAHLREALRVSGRSSFVPVGVCLTDAGRQDDLPPEPWPVPAARLSDRELLDVVRTYRAEAVVALPGPGIGPVELRRWAAHLQHEAVDLLVSPGLRDVATHRLGHASMGGRRLLRVRHPSLSGPGQWAKCLVDRVAAVLLLLLLSPALALLALLIRWDSPGPALFRQVRVGRDGRPFTVFKFRTMCRDADLLVDELAQDNDLDQDGVLFKIKKDPRVTPVGALLRTYSVDEVPQLLNVVRGEMSLVGPRPALPREVRAYDDDLRRRLDVKPGMTGLWQVSGRCDLSWDETVRLDLEYVDNWSWRLDVGIALRTVRAVLGHRGAY